MNFRWGTLVSALLAGAAINMVLVSARPAQAGSFFVSPRLPAKFLSELPPSETFGLALPAAADDSSLPDGKGKELTQKDCSTCHAVTIFTKLHHSRDEWSSVIDEMVSKGLDAPDADLATITDYLAAHFGPKTATPPAAADTPGPSTPQ